MHLSEWQYPNITMSTNLLKKHLTYSSSSVAKKSKHTSRENMKVASVVSNVQRKGPRNLMNIKLEEEDSNGEIGMYMHICVNKFDFVVAIPFSKLMLCFIYMDDRSGNEQY